jgi:hypothetical protein
MQRRGSGSELDAITDSQLRDAERGGLDHLRNPKDHREQPVRVVLDLVPPTAADLRLGAVRDDLNADLASKSPGVAAGGRVIFGMREARFGFRLSPSAVLTCRGQVKIF